jgi:hypothetical protein
MTIDHRKSIIVEITNKGELLNISVLNVQQFLR